MSSSTLTTPLPKKTITQMLEDGCKSFTYCISDGDLIKIGSTSDPDKRRAALQTGSSKDLHIIALFPSHKLEPIAHKKLAKCRVRGEWFRPSEDVMGFVEQIRDEQNHSQIMSEISPDPTMKQVDDPWTEAEEVSMDAAREFVRWFPATCQYCGRDKRVASYCLKRDPVNPSYHLDVQVDYGCGRVYASPSEIMDTPQGWLKDDKNGTQSGYNWNGSALCDAYVEIRRLENVIAAMGGES